MWDSKVDNNKNEGEIPNNSVDPSVPSVELKLLIKVIKRKAVSS